MVEDTGLEPVISLLAKQVQLPLCQSPKTRCILHYSRVCHFATPHSFMQDSRTRTGIRLSVTVPISIIHCC